MYKFLAYIKFLFRSTNQHGVHSPFVYALVTKCFYDRKKYSEYNTSGIHNKKAKLLFRVIQYFKPENLLIINADNSIEQLVQLADTNINIDYGDKFNSFKNLKYEVIYINFEEKKDLYSNLEKLLLTTKNDSVWIINNIHATTYEKNVWNSIKNNTKITVTIDVFYLGFVFFRREQEKENFTIRF